MKKVCPARVIWITTDHMRYDCIGAHGNAAMHTPNLDRLVNQGVSFEQCYVQNPLCMPSRCSFMTGLYPQQTGVTQNGHELPWDFEPTVARCFKAGGYHTTQIGKLHFQHHEEHDLDPRPRNDYGFDVMWLSEEGGAYQDAYMTWLTTERPDLVDTFRVMRPVSPERGGEVEGKVLEAPAKYSHSGWIGEEACRFLERSRLEKYRRTRQFVHLGFYAPHPPLNPTREMFEPYDGREIPRPFRGENEWDDKPEPLSRMLRMCADWEEERFIDYRRHFYAMVTGVDLAVGRVLEKLEAQGLLDDTLIVFSSDHGDMCGDHGMILKQISYYDELMRQPCVLFWPRGFGTGGRRVESLVEMVDLLPTMLGLSGCFVPEAMTGRNYAEELLAGDDVPARESALAYHEPGNIMVRTATQKYIRYGNDAEVLYDLEDDPHETLNRAADQPRLLERMRETALQRMLEASKSRLTPYYRF
ncbi:MAG: sulfatase-like hydrolase/transferase [Planctomycetes bacterium]|nr:sulfatase-like hydrolase/transferase [Planctomycetota bacterium]